MNETKIDFMSANGSQGEIAAMLNSGKLDIGKLRPYIDSKTGKAFVTVHVGGNPNDLSNYQTIEVNAGTLRREEWQQLDTALIQVAQSRLGGIQDLIDNGLVYNLGNGMGTTILESQTMSDAFEAVISMDGVVRGNNDRPTFDSNYLPIPIVHSDFQINLRTLESSRKLGNPLDTTSVELAGRKVLTKVEQMLFANTTFSFGGGHIYSYLNFPDRNVRPMGTAWDDASKTAQAIIDDVLSMKQASLDAKHYGPWMLYIPTSYETVMDEDYNSTKGITIRERILQYCVIKCVKDIDKLI